VVVVQVEVHRRIVTSRGDRGFTASRAPSGAPAYDLRAVETGSTHPEPPEPDGLSIDTSELDAIESGSGTRRISPVRPPQVRLGTLAEGGLAPALMAIVERGVRRRPVLASRIRAEIELVLEEDYPPVRIVFGDRLVLVEDGPAVAPDIRIEGTLPDLISLMVAPLLGGVPSPINARGRAALGKVAVGRVRIEGRIGLMRRLLAVIRI
jgi:hypothetical protein